MSERADWQAASERLEGVASRVKRADSEPSEVFEEVAEMFQAETGIVAPGKDSRSWRSTESRREAWESWREKQNRAYAADIARAAKLSALMASAPDAETLERFSRGIGAAVTEDEDGTMHDPVREWIARVAALLREEEGT